MGKLKMLRILLYFIMIISNFHTALPFFSPATDKFETRTGWRTYYHVTREENIDCIKKEGLLPKFGGINLGMSELYKLSHNNQDTYTKESVGYIHITPSWATLTQYSNHMLGLLEKLNRLEIFKNFPIILKHDSHKHIFACNDPHDKEALRSRQAICPNKIFILASYRPSLKEEGDYLDDKKECFWLPLKKWDSSLYIPAYPETDSNKFLFDDDTIRKLLEDRIVIYSRSGLNKKKVAKYLYIDPKTLNKFINKDPTLRISTKERIINNFFQCFLDLTQYDKHFVILNKEHREEAIH